MSSTPVTLTESTKDLIAFLDAKLNDLMINLYRNRQALSMLQDRAESDASLIATVGMALAAVRQQERTLADVQRRLDDIRGSTAATRPIDSSRSR